MSLFPTIWNYIIYLIEVLNAHLATIDEVFLSRMDFLLQKAEYFRSASTDDAASPTTSSFLIGYKHRLTLLIGPFTSSQRGRVVQVKEKGLVIKPGAESARIGETKGSSMTSIFY